MKKMKKSLEHCLEESEKGRIKCNDDRTHQFASPVQHQVNDLLADGVVATGVVVGSVLLPSDQLLRVEELAVGSCAHLIWKGKSALN